MGTPALLPGGMPVYDGEGPARATSHMPHYSRHQVSCNDRPEHTLPPSSWPTAHPLYVSTSLLSSG